MSLNELVLWWSLFLVSNAILAAATGLLVKAGPFARVRVPALLSTFLFICGLTLFLVAGKQNLLQATIAAITGH
ncbi:protein-S-isoprenylcysteine O-methyltransferase Ste14 [Symbiobacterium terraclitae]|uniref:Protein-S-isoprenylcysteine O-methyltransferase Ste14 n=1 Tax=Symbiobacterium terraclitae TaxID=557451 RepID=A0ABS4JUX6_9FIRM|nr:hypothetical protein [Symbiobacterium terraclitae]MBP2019347.1 protein-S-isoprenylcysteine O-methyltransferase Ste14 [Symbiobacterium terraclitae]